LGPARSRRSEPTDGGRRSGGERRRLRHLVITRIAGVPSGPLAGAPLPAGFADSVATTLEGLAVVAALAALAAWHRGARSPHARAAILIAAGGIAIPLTTLAVLSQAGVIPALPPSI
jgi:hypothetical protein